MAKGINLKDRRQISFSDFGGVDLSSSAVKVKNGRAAKIKNFYKEDGVIKKRPGYKEIAKVDGKIQKILKYGDELFICAIKDGQGNIYRFAEGACVKIGESFDAESAEMFYNKEKIFILTGKEFLALYEENETFVLKSVSEIAYIPTTTLGIPDTISREPSLRYTLDAVNMLTPLRKNKLEIREVYGDIQKYKFEFEDADDYKVSGDYSEQNPAVFEFPYPVGNKKSDYGAFGLTLRLGETWYVQYVSGVQYADLLELTTSAMIAETEYKLSNYLKCYIDFSREVLCVKIVNPPEMSLSFYDSNILNDVPNVEIDFVPLKAQTFKLDSSIDDDTTPILHVEYKSGGGDTFQASAIGHFNREKGEITIEDASPYAEITVEFSHSSERENTPYADFIKNCRFGTIFGTTGNSNRLFVSGNPDFPNIEFWSESEDYTYFPDLNYNAVGSDLTAIVGYSRLSDEVLAVFKERGSFEPTVYYKSADYKESYDEQGNLVYAVTTFPTYAGNVGETIISRAASADLGGDALILSENGIYGIVMKQNINTSERYMHERSQLINKVLRKNDLKNAVGFVYRGRYYLSVGDGTVYLADSRYKSSLSGDMDNSFNYEWWVLDNIPATAFAEINGDLYFGTADGRLCIFDEEYADRLYHKSGPAEVSLSATEGYFVYASTAAELNEHTLVPGARIEINANDDIYFKVCEANVRDGVLQIEPAALEALYEGNEIYFDNVGNSALLTGAAYVIASVDRGECTVTLEGASPSISDGIIVVKKIAKAQYYVREVLPANNLFSISEYPDSENIPVYSYLGITPSAFTVTVEERRDVEAVWKSGVMSFGTITEAKSLLSMTISARASYRGVLHFGYSTKYGASEHYAQGVESLDFTDFSFEGFALDNDFQSAHTVRCYERNFNYIQFYFRSESGEATVHDLVATYKINKRFKGVR